jgi:PAS domain-containing protein
MHLPGREILLRRCRRRTSDHSTPKKPLELILARNLLTNISIPGFLSDHRGVLVFYNEAAGALLGIPFEHAGHLDPGEWGARFGPFDSAGARIPFEEVPLTIALREGRPVHAPLYIHSVDRQVNHIEVSAIPLTTNDAITGVVGIFWRTEGLSPSARPEPSNLSPEAGGLRE